MAVDQVDGLPPPSRVRLTTKRWSTGTRHSSFTAGANQAVCGSSACAATAKPKAEGCALSISVKVAPLSVERKIPLWCWTQIVSGSARHCARRCTSWLSGTITWSGGTYSARSP